MKNSAQPSNFSQILESGETLLWTGQANTASMMPVMALLISISGLCSWILGKILVANFLLGDACVQFQIYRCGKLFTALTFAFLLSGTLFMKFMYSIFGHALGFTKTYFAITNRRAIKVSRGIFVKGTSIQIYRNIRMRTYVGCIRFGEFGLPLLNFVGLPRKQIKEILYWVAKGTQE